MAAYRLVQGKAQAAMFVQHKESALPFLWDRTEALSTASQYVTEDMHLLQKFWQIGYCACTICMCVSVHVHLVNKH